jgi:GT2 family glycosyltransferase
MEIYYCIPTYRAFEECKASIHAVMQGSIQPDHIIVIDNSGNSSAIRVLQDLPYSNVIFWPQEYNLGVARSWNTFHRQIDKDYIIIANDDIAVHAHTIERLITSAQEHPDTIIHAGDGTSGNMYSLFLLTHKGFTTLGPFDERFYPAYFEDNDYERRRILANLSAVLVSGATYDHAPSSTIKKYTPAEMDDHHRSFQRNQQYYIAKWNGLPHQERYTTAFDGLL